MEYNNEWEVLQSTLFLLKSILEAKKSLAKLFFEKFSNIILSLIVPQQVDDVLLLSAETIELCLENLSI